MPIYPFRCPEGHAEDVFRKIESRNRKKPCGTCRKPMTRQFAAFGIAGEHHAHTFYESERQKWALATGQQHQTAGELKDWCDQNGKTIVEPGFKPKKPEDFSEREALKALDKIHSENHSLGTVDSGGG